MAHVQLEFLGAGPCPNYFLQLLSQAPLESYRPSTEVELQKGLR